MRGAWLLLWVFLLIQRAFRTAGSSRLPRQPSCSTVARPAWPSVNYMLTSDVILWLTVNPGLTESAMSQVETTERAHREIHCSFCGKSQVDVDMIVAGPGVKICNECVELAAKVIAENRGRPKSPQTMFQDYRATDDLLRALKLEDQAFEFYWPGDAGHRRHPSGTGSELGSDRRGSRRLAPGGVEAVRLKSLRRRAWRRATGPVAGANRRRRRAPSSGDRPVRAATGPSPEDIATSGRR